MLKPFVKFQLKTLIGERYSFLMHHVTDIKQLKHKHIMNTSSDKITHDDFLFLIYYTI